MVMIVSIEHWENQWKLNELKVLWFIHKMSKTVCYLFHCELMNYLMYHCFIIKAGTLPSGVWFDWLTCGVFTHSAVLHYSWLPLGTNDSPYLWTVIGNYIISLPALNLLMKLLLLAFFHLGGNQMNFFPSFLPNLIL